jgi:class 3 adenylate cyclase
MSGKTQRRLAAILVSDVVGCSRMMESDATGTLHCLSQVVDGTFDRLIAHRDGRVVKLADDGVLAEFASVVDGASGVIGQQKQTPDNALAPFRVGINVDDIIVQGR